MYTFDDDDDLFQSTLPTRGSDVKRRIFSGVVCISIHAPHEGERPAPLPLHGISAANFNPRSPRGGATFRLPSDKKIMQISIHAPHEGERRIAPFTAM